MYTESDIESKNLTIPINFNYFKAVKSINEDQSSQEDKYLSDKKRFKKRSSTNLRFEFSPRIEIVPDSRRQSKKFVNEEENEANQKPDDRFLKIINKYETKLSKPKILKSNSNTTQSKFSNFKKSESGSKNVRNPF